jgi:hypothetical protein
VKLKPAELAIGAVGLAVAVIGVIALRDATLSTHTAMDPDSRAELVLDAQSRHAEPGQTLPEMVEALVLTCRLEVRSDLVGSIRAEGDGRFRAVFQPALDESDSKQLRGCLEDWTIDSLRAEVVSLAPAS